MGYDRPLYLLAFDHRGSFEHDLFGASEPVPDDVRARIVDAKEVIFEAFEDSVTRGVAKEAAGVLVDEEYGSTVARRARSNGNILAMPVEKSGQEEFVFEYGEEFGAHIEAFDPTFAKVLVRYNPDADHALNARQTERLARLTGWLHERERRFLFELLVPATSTQLAAAGGEQRRYDAEQRPGLVVRAIHELQEGGVEPDLWKVEGLDSVAACEQVVMAARRGGRERVCCIVLGRGADEAQVLRWLKIASGVDGFVGFAVGRTLWENALVEYIAKTKSRQDAVRVIADRYLDVVEGFSG